MPGGWEQAGSKVRVRGMQEAERRLFPSFLWPLTPGATLFCQVLKIQGFFIVFTTPNRAAQGRAEVQVGSATSVSAPALQTQNRSKPSSGATSSADGSSWVSSATPALVSIHRRPSASPPRRSIGERGAHPLRRQSPGARLPGKLSPTAEQQGGVSRTVSPSPGARGERGVVHQL